MHGSTCYLEHRNRKKAAVGGKQLSTTDSIQGQRHRQTKGAHNEQLHARVDSGYAAADLEEKSAAAGYSDVVSRERCQPEDFSPWQLGIWAPVFLKTWNALRQFQAFAVKVASLHRCIVCKSRLQSRSATAVLQSPEANRTQATNRLVTAWTQLCTYSTEQFQQRSATRTAVHGVRWLLR